MKLWTTFGHLLTPKPTSFSIKTLKVITNYWLVISMWSTVIQFSRKEQIEEKSRPKTWSVHSDVFMTMSNSFKETTINNAWLKNVLTTEKKHQHRKSPAPKNIELLIPHKDWKPWLLRLRNKKIFVRHIKKCL